MNDMISRQDAINSPVKMVSEGLEWIPVYHIKELPSAEPEIIRCKDCKYWISNGCKEVGCLEYDFCSYAERRGDSDE